MFDIQVGLQLTIVVFFIIINLPVNCFQIKQLV